MNINGRSSPFGVTFSVGHADDVHIICGFLRSHQGLCLADRRGVLIPLIYVTSPAWKAVGTAQTQL